MRTTRRGFLATVGLGAAAAALAPVQVEAADHIGTQYKCVTCQYRTRAVSGSVSLADAADDICTHMVAAHAGVQQPTFGVQDIAQIRADEYNRGYLQATLRAENTSYRWVQSEGSEPRRIRWTDA